MSTEKKRYTTKETAVKLGVRVQRILAKIDKGHFPSACKCECGSTYMIDVSDILNQPQRGERYVKKNNIISDFSEHYDNN